MIIGSQHGYKKEIFLLIEINKSFGDNPLYLSFSSDGSACMISDSLKQDIDVENIIKIFKQILETFVKNELFSVPQKLEQNFSIQIYLLNKQFKFFDFEIKFASNIIQELKFISIQQISMRTNNIEFIGEQLQCTIKRFYKIIRKFQKSF